MKEPSFWRVECTEEQLESASDTLNEWGSQAEWYVVADNVTEHHHAVRLAERYLYGGDGYKAARIVPVWVEVRSGTPENALRR